MAVATWIIKRMSYYDLLLRILSSIDVFYKKKLKPMSAREGFFSFARSIDYIVTDRKVRNKVKDNTSLQGYT